MTVIMSIIIDIVEVAVNAAMQLYTASNQAYENKQVLIELIEVMNKFTFAFGRRGCIPCPSSGLFSLPGTSICTPCPAGSTSAGGTSMCDVCSI